MNHVPFVLDDELRPVLEDAGWSDAYRRDVAEWLPELVAEGFSINPLAQHVLERLGGLALSPRPVEVATFGSGEVVFEPLWAASGEVGRIAMRERQLDTTLCPVGEWCGEYVLLAGGDGCMYAETSFQLVRIGRNLTEALRTILLADSRPVEI
jgi:hypothetical protein